MSSFDGSEYNSSFSGRKGKTCSMNGCPSTHQRCPSMSFFRFPKEVNRAKEWITICQRPDLMKRLDAGEININNYYMCEAHFDNQILDYATRKILVRHATPTPLVESKFNPSLMNGNGQLGLAQFDHVDLDEEDDDDYADDVDEEYLKGLTPQVIISKAVGGYQPDGSIAVSDDDYYMDEANSRNQLYWTPQATRLLIKLRGARESDFEQSGARKSQLWLEICDKMRENGYDLSAERVSKKWHNIMITYNKNLAKKYGSVNWEFFEDIDVIYRNRKLQEADDEADAYQYDTPITLDHLKQNGVDLKPAVASKRKRTENAADEPDNQKVKSFDAVNGGRQRKEPESSSNSSEQHSVSLLKRLRQTMATDSAVPPVAPESSSPSEEKWWREYLERKLELEKEKLRREEDRHRDLMNFRKMSIMLQEKTEKVKVDALNGLTSAITKLLEAKFT